jgi:hypothetical protein
MEVIQEDENEMLGSVNAVVPQQHLVSHNQQESEEEEVQNQQQDDDEGCDFSQSTDDTRNQLHITKLKHPGEGSISQLSQQKPSMHLQSNSALNNQVFADSEFALDFIFSEFGVNGITKIHNDQGTAHITDYKKFQQIIQYSGLSDKIQFGVQKESGFSAMFQKDGIVTLTINTTNPLTQNDLDSFSSTLKNYEAIKQSQGFIGKFQ